MTPSPVPSLTVVVDSQEQQPWLFGDGVSVQRAPLKTGDYSVAGLEGRICIERKSIADLYKSLIHDKARFQKEIRRMTRMDHACVIAEGPSSELMEYVTTTGATLESVIGSINALHVYTNIPVFFYSNRLHAATFALNWLQQAARASG